jgi:hypothetical protein
MLATLVAASAVLTDSGHWSHRRINSHTFEILGPTKGSDADRMKVADRLCPKSGWESDGPITLVKGGRGLKWRVVCRAR